jgi:hypothetical protein
MDFRFPPNDEREALDAARTVKTTKNKRKSVDLCDARSLND